MHTVYKQIINTYINKDSFSGSGVVMYPRDSRLWEVEGGR